MRSVLDSWLVTQHLHWPSEHLSSLNKSVEENMLHEGRLLFSVINLHVFVLEFEGLLGVNLIVPVFFLFDIC